jgi:hypothetical protein
VTSQLETLIELNIQDFMAAGGLAQIPFGRGLLRALLRPAAARFARNLIEYDHEVGAGGLERGGRTLIKRYATGLRVAGQVPRTGPVFILANHPGLTDTVALFAAIARPDLKLLALDRPFLKALPNTAERLFMLPDDPPGRLAMIRAAATYLRRGGALLTFPAGEIEPDPLALPGAVESLSNWSESIGVFARFAPRAQLVTAIVSGVLNPAAQQNPIIRLRKDRRQREFLGATLQILWPAYRRNVVQVAFSPPFAAADLIAIDPDPSYVTCTMVEAARNLIERPPAVWETVFDRTA